MTRSVPQLSVGEYTSILRQDFGSFATRAFYEVNSGDKLGWNWHLDVLSSKLADAAKGKITRLIIALPPRGLKSSLVSVALPAWILGQRPGAKILCASYGQDLSDDLARKSFSIMSAPWYMATFPTRLAPNRRAVSDFHTTARGYRRSASVGGALTGFGADFIIVDDPQKPGEALSDVQRRTANTWFDETLLTRLNNKAEGCIIIVMQRLHEDDLVGHVLAQSDQWEVVSFPAIAEVEETYRWTNAFGEGQHIRRAGEALHEEREPVAVLEGLRRQMGSYLFSAQYQQQPMAREGARINVDWFQRYDSGNPPTFEKTIQSWDTAHDIGERNDFSVCTTWSMKDQQIYLRHVYRERLLYPELERKVIELAEAWHADRVIVEKHSSGSALVQNLPSRQFYKAEAFKPQGDKAMRMENHSGMIESGRVFIPRDAPWLDTYLYELQAFPNGRFDDQVDSTSQALEWINTGGREPGILIAYRRLAEEKERGQSRSAETVKLRAPSVGYRIEHFGQTILPDENGVYHLPVDGLHPRTIGSYLANGWTKVD